MEPVSMSLDCTIKNSISMLFGRNMHARTQDLWTLGSLEASLRASVHPPQLSVNTGGMFCSQDLQCGISSWCGFSFQKHARKNTLGWVDLRQLEGYILHRHQPVRTAGPKQWQPTGLVVAWVLLVVSFDSHTISWGKHRDCDQAAANNLLLQRRRLYLTVLRLMLSTSAKKNLYQLWGWKRKCR